MTSDEGFVLTGRHVLLMLIAFFGVIVVANVIYIYYAISSFSGEESPRAYAQGLQYNEVLAAREAQAALGWSLQVKDQPTDAGGLELTLHMADRAGAPVTGLEGTVVLRRPTHDGEDRTAVLAADGPGRYVTGFEAPADGTLRGAWQVQMILTRTGTTVFTAERRLWID